MGLTTTREFRWDDPAAPVLNGEPGTFYHLLKTCLVGTAGIAYGSGANERRAAGWELAWDDPGAFKAVFRNSQAHGGSGCYLRVDDGSSMYTSVECFRLMTDIDNGLDSTGARYWLKSNVSNGSVRAWLLCADELTVYICSAWNAAEFNINMFPRIYAAGDIHSYIPGDPFNYFCAGMESRSAPGYPGIGGLHVATTILGGGAATGGSQCVIGRGSDYSPGATALSAAITIGSGTGQEIGFNSGLPWEPPHVGRRFSTPTVAISSGSIRGVFRGLYSPLNKVSGRGGTIINADDGARFSVFTTAYNASADRQGGFFVETRKGW